MFRQGVFALVMPVCAGRVGLVGGRCARVAVLGRVTRRADRLTRCADRSRFGGMGWGRRGTMEGCEGSDRSVGTVTEWARAPGAEAWAGRGVRPASARGRRTGAGARRNPRCTAPGQSPCHSDCFDSPGCEYHPMVMCGKHFGAEGGDRVAPAPGWRRRAGGDAAWAGVGAADVAGMPNIRGIWANSSFRTIHPAVSWGIAAFDRGHAG
ncbi:MAG: hypothetical protein JWN03_6664 [Nocardia sp.]|nr:hypothetical protein [Nocardia sp.]